MTAPIKFRRGPFQDAADNYSHARDALAAATDKLTSAMSGAGGAAGSDDPGKAFSGPFEDAARKGAEGATAVILTTGNVHDLLQQTAFNYAAANHIDPAKEQADKAVPDWVSPLYYLPNFPTVFGGSVKNPSWWAKLQSWIGGKIWPNGDSSKLNDIADAFSQAAKTFDSVGQSLGATNSMLGDQQVPEAGQITSNTGKVVAALHQMGDNFRLLANAAQDYADALDEAHHQLNNQVKHIVEAAIVAAAAGIFAIVASAGTLTLLGGSMEAGSGGAMAFAAARATSILDALLGGAAAVGATAPLMAAQTGVKIAEIEDLLHTQLLQGQYNEISVNEDPASRRVHHRQSTLRAIEQRMKDKNLESPDGKDWIDYNTGKPFSKEGPKDVGHVDTPWWKIQQMARDQGWSRPYLRDYDNNPDNLLFEDPSSNRSNRFTELPKRGK